jgi:nitroimidazol reductase NimA-like FMN-containing flavoprotein (pyridoxamine 5'-phosphate oxidase superfamily)
MERHDISDELATAGAQELLASAALARLAYAGPDGTPRVIPVAFFWGTRS